MAAADLPDRVAKLFGVRMVAHESNGARVLLAEDAS
jgi:hypothetical protein